jgi:hypothetical protein
MSKGLLERASDLIQKRKRKNDDKMREIEERRQKILRNGETEDDDSKRPQGRDERR